MNDKAEPGSGVPKEIRHLGHPVVRMAGSMYFALALMVALPLGAIGILGSLLVFVGLADPKNPHPTWEQDRMIIALGFLVVGVPFFALGYYAWRQYHRRIWFGQNGLAWGMPGKFEIFLWDDLEEVGFPTRLKRRDGYRVNLHRHVENHWDFVKLIQARWVPLQVLKALAELEAGNVIKFGVFTVTPKGVQKDGELLLWEEFQGMTRFYGQSNSLSLSKKGKTWAWASASVTKIKNDLVFEALVGVLVARAEKPKQDHR